MTDITQLRTKPYEYLLLQEEEKLSIIRNKWINALYQKLGQTINQQKTIELLEFVHPAYKDKQPELIICQSPYEAQVRANEFTTHGQQIWAQVRDQIGNQVWDQIRNQIGNQNKLKYYNFSDYLGVNDYYWLAYYDFFTEIGLFNHDGFNCYRDLVYAAKIYDSLLFENVAILIDFPIAITEQDIVFADGYRIIKN
jgi:hypothetical protein